MGVAGELYIGGAGLARGYARRPALTAERFVPDPFGAAGTRLYRTGDRVRARADGALEYLGRSDQQLKIRGHRIEPGEIEARLSEHASVRQALVAGANVAAGEKRLVAYLLLEPQAAPDGITPALLDELRTLLKARLPDYMLPQHYVLLEQLPLTPNGKLDRKRLPAFEPNATRREYVAPGTQLQQQLAGFWQELLGVPRVGLHDNFFELGGHSLLATQLLSRIREQLGIELPLRALFEAVTVAELAEILETRSAQAISDQALDEMASLLDELETVK
jgi:acyl carrier protein